MRIALSVFLAVWVLARVYSLCGSVSMVQAEEYTCDNNNATNDICRVDRDVFDGYVSFFCKGDMNMGQTIDCNLKTPADPPEWECLEYTWRTTTIITKDVLTCDDACGDCDWQTQ